MCLISYRLQNEGFFPLVEVEEFIQEVEVQLTAVAGVEVEAEGEVCPVTLWWITVPGRWRFLRLQRVIEKIFCLILRYFLTHQINASDDHLDTRYD